MQTGVSAAVAAMEQAVRRLDAALAQRASAFRALAEQHGLAVAELKRLREELQAVRAEADALRERAALVDALREELAQMQREEEAGHAAVPAAAPVPQPVPQPAPLAAAHGGDAEITALKAELAAARAAQDEMQAFQAGIAARLEATMARLRQALDSQAQG